MSLSVEHPAAARSGARLRVAFLADTYFGGGGEKQALMMARALAESPEVELTLISLTPQPRQVWDYVNRYSLRLITLRRRVELDPFALAGLFRLWLKLKPQVVDAWLARPALWAGLTLPPGIRLVFHQRNSGYRDEAELIPYPARQRLALLLIRPRISLMVANSPKGLRDWRKLAALSPRRSVYLPNYFEPPLMADPGVGEVARLRQDVGIAEGERVILAVGRLKLPEKGQHDLIRAFARLEPGRRGLRLLLVGDGPAKAELSRLAEELGVAGQVSLLGWRDDVEALLHLADLYVLPSRSEGFPNALLEALLHHRPIVATKVGAVEEILAGGQYGLLVPPGRPERLAEAIAQGLERKQELARMAEAGAASVQNRYAPGRVLRAFLSLHRELIRGRRDFSDWGWDKS